jgi:micrococcal nuclease
LLALLLLSAPLARADNPPPGGPGLQRVERVVDGDTVVLAGGARVRILNINTPEKRERLGPEAGQAARKLLLGKGVWVVGKSKDPYGRLLGDLLVDGRSFAQQMVNRGLAHVFLIPPVQRKQADRLLAAQRRARKRRLGIWATDRYQGAFHITSFHANAPGDDNKNLNGEYLRIACIAHRPTSLRGYRLTNSKGEGYEFPAVTIPPGQTFIVHSGRGDNQTDPRRQLALYWGRDTPAWGNRGDTATLLDPRGERVDQVLHKKGGRRRR